MRRAYLILAILTAFLLPIAGHANAREPVTVDAEGMAIKSDTYDVRKKAIEDALKNSVAASVDVAAKEGGHALVDEAAMFVISSKASSYILTYKILSEGWLTHFDIEPKAVEAVPSAAQPIDVDAQQQSMGVDVYHIRIKAVVDAQKLAAALASQSVSSTAKPASSVRILFAEMPDYAAYSAALAVVGAVPEIHDLDNGEFYPGRITFTAAVSGNAAQFAARLAKELGEGFTVTLTDARNITIKPAKPQAPQTEAQ